MSLLMTILCQRCFCILSQSQSRKLCHQIFQTQHILPVKHPKSMDCFSFFSHFFSARYISPFQPKNTRDHKQNPVFDLEVKWFRTWLRWATCDVWWVLVTGVGFLGPFHEIFNAFKNQDLCQKLETRNRMPAPFFVPAILNEFFLERVIF